MNSRLDLLKKGAGNSKEKDSEQKPRAGILDEKSQESQHRHDDLIERNKDNAFESETDHSQSSDYNVDADNNNNDNLDENINVIEINLDESQGLDPSILGDDFEQEEQQEKEADTPLESEEIKTEDTNFDNEIVEGRITVDYSEKDIKQELEYIFDQREQVHDLHFRIIKDGGIEISTPKILHLGDIIRISVTLTELKEQVGCEARIVSIYPKNIRLSNNENNNQYRYIAQFVGPNASETERVLSKYLLGYKIK